MNSKHLFLFSILYLFVPNLLFLVFWLDPIFSIITLFLMAFGYFLFFKRTRVVFEIVHFSLKNCAILLGLALIITLFLGYGGLFPQVYNFWGHNAKLYDLYVHNWPLVLPEMKTFYAYFWGYYLPIAALAKVFNGHLVFFNLFWQSIGIFLGLLWVFAFLDRKIVKLLVAISISTPIIYVVNLLLAGYITENVFLKNSAWLLNFGLGMQWEPHQTIPAAIVVGFLLWEFKTATFPYLFLLFLPLLFIWSPFLILSFSCILFLFLIINEKRRAYFELFYQNIFSCLAFFLAIIPFVFYFKSNHTSAAFEFDFKNLSLEWLFGYFIFAIFNFLLITICNYQSEKDRGMKALFISITIYLVLSCGLKLGVHNDFVTKSTILPILIIHFCFGKIVFEMFAQKAFKLAILLMYFLSLSGFASILFFQTKGLDPKKLILLQQRADSKPISQYHSINKLLLEKFSAEEALQYRGDMDSFYAKYLAKNRLKTALSN